MPRGRYNRISPMDRRRIVRAANDGGNWRQLAEQLGVNHKTAYTWFVKVATKQSRKGEDAESVLMNKSICSCCHD